MNTYIAYNNPKRRNKRYTFALPRFIPFRKLVSQARDHDDEVVPPKKSVVSGMCDADFAQQLLRSDGFKVKVCIWSGFFVMKRRNNCLFFGS
ncbi:hypothetical protein V6N12_020711 [Hibiscus sabdariffa]|uniref:Uncharacterized protein n=1 Tax=Hibiscus sabdariffa TaxID=183260 RepID=A0ABR2D0K2_9ROSI